MLPWSATVHAAPAADSLDPATLREAIEVLQKNHATPDSVSADALTRATAQGLLERLETGFEILTGTNAPEPERPFRQEALPGEVYYIRLGSLVATKVESLDAALVAHPSKGLILDLRDTPDSGEFEVAAEIARRFCPKGRPLFSLRRAGVDERVVTSNRDPSFTGHLAVVVSPSTSGAAEVIAALLRQHANALIVGRQTAGRGARMQEFPLRNGARVRVATGEVVIPDAAPIHPDGLKPDIKVDVADSAENEALEKAAEAGVISVVEEKERVRMNEAALVAGTNPEIETIQEAQKNKGKEKPKEIRDITLQRAMDALITLDAIQLKN